MNVNEIRDRIVELSHQSATDGEIQAKALGWLNAAYHELMDEILPYAPPAMQRQETVTTGADGTATLAFAPYKVLCVVDMPTGNILPRATPLQVVAADPTGTATGPFRSYTATGTGVRGAPAGVSTLSVLYVPEVVDLAENGTEDTVILPKPYHIALVWGGLVWSALFERGFGTQGELAMFQAQWQRAKESVKLNLVGNAGLRVAAYGA